MKPEEKPEAKALRLLAEANSLVDEFVKTGDKKAAFEAMRLLDEALKIAGFAGLGLK